MAVLLLVAAGLLLSEIVVRLVLPYSSPETIRAYSLDYESSPFTRIRFGPTGRLVEVDPEKAWGLKPADAESERTFYINDLGFRGPSFLPRKPTGLTRVFVLGGSAVFDQSVSDDAISVGNSWPNRAQTLLEDRGFEVEVINAGTPSHSTTDAVGRLGTEIWLYEPDIVILYNAWNDIKNFHAYGISPEEPLHRHVKPFDPTADPYRNYLGRVDRALSVSQLYMKFRNRYLGARMAVGEEGTLPTGSVASDYGPFGPRQYELNLRNFVDVARNIGARPVLATQASLVQNPEAGAEERIDFRYQLLDQRGLARAFEEVYEITRNVATAEQVPLLDAATVLGGESAYLTDHVHLSPEGSEAMAQLVAEFLASLLKETAGPQS